MSIEEQFSRSGIPLDLAPMEDASVKALPEGADWQFEPKWDGFRCLAFRAGRTVELKAKSGKSLTRFFPDVHENLLALPVSDFVVDGEILIEVDGRFAFDALQNRLHPARSRVEMLATRHPAMLVAFDCLLAAKAERLIDKPFAERRAALEAMLPRGKGVALTPFTLSRTTAQRWLERPDAARDGVIAKRLDLAYRPGERAMQKVKPLRTADCVMGWFRYETGRKLVGSLLLGLYDEQGLLHHVGFTSSIREADRKDLTVRLAKRMAPPGFTGDAPGEPSRWSNERSAAWQPLRPELVVEVQYDHVTGRRFRHGTRLLRWRPDKSPHQCTFEQLPAAPAGGARLLTRTA